MLDEGADMVARSSHTSPQVHSTHEADKPQTGSLEELGRVGGNALLLDVATDNEEMAPHDAEGDAGHNRPTGVEEDNNIQDGVPPQEGRKGTGLAAGLH
jgi:hypothetical protein